MDRTYEKYLNCLDDEYSGAEYGYFGGSTGFWSTDESYSNVHRILLDKSDSEYIQVSQMFQKTGSTKKFSLMVQNVEKITNLGLIKKFERKKEEYKQKYGHVSVVKVFHGTKNINIPSILKNNLDVQRHGQSVGHRFGAGVSFSRFSNYASHYCDESHSGDQMLLCYVIISNIIEVPELRRRGEVLKEPPFIEGRYPLRYDTTAKNKHSMDVIVKFENDTFYPAYIIHFVKTQKSFTTAPDSTGKSISNLSRAYTKDNVVEKGKVGPPFSKISADVPGFRSDPTPILNPLSRISTKSGTSVRRVSLLTPYVVPRHQEIIVPSHQQVSRPRTHLEQRDQENIGPEQVSKPKPPIDPRRQESIASRPAAGTHVQRMSSYPRTTNVPRLAEEPTDQSQFLHALRSFFSKLCCCFGDKK